MFSVHLWTEEWRTIWSWDGKREKAVSKAKIIFAPWKLCEATGQKVKKKDDGEPIKEYTKGNRQYFLVQKAKSNEIIFLW